jgi:hypothetical protein
MSYDSLQVNVTLERCMGWQAYRKWMTCPRGVMTVDGCSRRNEAGPYLSEFWSGDRKDMSTWDSAQHFWDCVAMCWSALWLWPSTVNSSSPSGSTLGLAFQVSSRLANFPPSLLRVNSTRTGRGGVLCCLFYPAGTQLPRVTGHSSQGGSPCKLLPR